MPGPVPLQEPEEEQNQPGGSVLDNLKREGKAALQTVTSLPSSLYHAAADPAQAGEDPKLMHSIGPTGRLIERSIIQPTREAGSFYNRFIHATPSDRSAMESGMLSVAPEAMGSAAGTVGLGGAVKSGIDIAKGAPVGRTLVGGGKVADISQPVQPARPGQPEFRAPVAGETAVEKGARIQANAEAMDKAGIARRPAARAPLTQEQALQADAAADLQTKLNLRGITQQPLKDISQPIAGSKYPR